MKRTTISLPDEIAGRLEREARRRATSVSAIAREVFAAHFGFDRADRRRLPFESLGRSGYHDTAERVEEILAEEWGGTRDR